MKRRVIGSILLATAVVLSSMSLGCASKQHPKPAPPVEGQTQEAPPPPPLPMEGVESTRDGSDGPAPQMRSTPVSQVGFERSAPSHGGMSVTGLRFTDDSGSVVAEQHHALTDAVAVAASGVAKVKDIAWTAAADGQPGLLELNCSDCAGIDLNNDRSLANVTFVSSTYDALTRKTILTLTDGRDRAQTLTLKFSDADQAGRWASAARASAGAAEARITIPRGSPSAKLTFQLGDACPTDWTWRQAPSAG